MFVIELTYTAPLSDIDANMAAHVRFLHKHYAAGNFLLSGRKIPRDGGIIVAAGTSRKDMEAIIREDPFVERGLAFYTVHGIEPKRLMSDNAFVYRHNRSLRELLADREIRHLFIRPRRPQTNGKVERYQQTLKREWALGEIYRSSEHRARALSHCLGYYNERRPHSSLGGRPPITRVHNLPRQDI